MQFPAALLARLSTLLVLLAVVPVASVGAQSQTGAIVSSATAFLATLSPEERQKVQYAFGDADQRARWSNFPTGVVPRGGLSLKQLNAAQRAAVLELLGVLLSPMGLEKVNEIRQADDDFRANGSKRGPGGGGRFAGPGGPGGPVGPGGQNVPRPPFPGSPPVAGADLFGSTLYYISFLGKPSMTAPWMLQFGGHHLALNVTFAGGTGTLTPTLTGAQPAAFTVNGKVVRPLGRESDRALALIQALDPQQRKQAVLGYDVADLVLGPGQDNKKIVPEGLKVSAMTPEQQTLLMGLIAEWVGILNDNSSAARMAQIKAELNESWFAWSGPVTGKSGDNITAYYRIQGPHLVIEYAPQRDEPANHVHTIYRDPTNDYGAAFVRPGG